MQKRVKKRILPLVLALILVAAFVSEAQVFAAVDTTTFAEGFNHPGDVALDNGGNVYVADTDNHRIQKFKSNGEFIATWGA